MKVLCITLLYLWFFGHDVKYEICDMMGCHLYGLVCHYSYFALFYATIILCPRVCAPIEIHRAVLVASILNVRKHWDKRYIRPVFIQKHPLNTCEKTKGKKWTNEAQCDLIKLSKTIVLFWWLCKLCIEYKYIKISCNSSLSVWTLKLLLNIQTYIRKDIYMFKCWTSINMF